MITAFIQCKSYIESITISTDQGVIEVINVTFVVNPSPTVIIEGENTLIFGDSVTLTARGSGGTGDLSYTWATGETDTSIIVAPTETTEYTVNIVDTQGFTASVSITITVLPETFNITATPTSTIFDSRTVGYLVSPDGKTITITNEGNRPITLTPPTAVHFDIGQLTSTALLPGETATFTIRPKTGLDVGTYSDNITVIANEGYASENAVTIVSTFAVNTAATVSISGESLIIAEQSTNLLASAIGGTGAYTYLWNTGEQTAEITVSPTETTTYTVSVTDESGIMVNMTFTVNVIPRTYTINTRPISLDFGIRSFGYTQAPAEQVFSVENLGNGLTILEQPTSEKTRSNFIIGSLSKKALGVGEVATFTVRPRTGLAVGTYTETITITSNGGSSFRVTVTFEVSSLPTVSIIGNTNISNGETAILTANIVGGKAPFTYLWNTGDRNNRISVQPHATTTYSVLIEDSLGIRSTAEFTVKVDNPTNEEQPGTTENPSIGQIGGIDLVPNETIQNSRTAQDITESANLFTAFDYGEGQIIVVIPSHSGITPAMLPNQAALIESVLSLQELGRVANGDSIEIKLDVMCKEAVLKQDEDLIDEAIRKFNDEIPGLERGIYIDITLSKRIENEDWELISDAGNPIEIVIDVPESMRIDGAEYYIIRSHEGGYTLLEDQDDDPNTITILSQYFSTYAIAYRSTAEAKHTTCFWHWITLVVALLFIAFTFLWKEERAEKRLIAFGIATVLMLIPAIIGIAANGCFIGLIIAIAGSVIGFGLNYVLLYRYAR